MVTLLPKRCSQSRPRALIARPKFFRLNAPGMRAVIQRVTRAEVTIDGTSVGTISQGLVVLVAVEESDRREEVEWLSGKIVRLRVFSRGNEVMNYSVREIGGGILVVSQFTLFASTRKGNRPSYSRAAPPEVAIPIYQAFLNQLAADLGRPIECGRFGADMRVSLINDGPVTIVIDSKLRE
jgi:D-aminoacyl-tRNA deacylase